ncbi:hypothetical protein LZ554_005401 [Drepanopeziza brunnea f. sp. 'monogermtubi']|nr:hypothetical protein LZ554_005401 [Drepanopeziza brunnea f. sp. 'monogermtubi']
MLRSKSTWAISLALGFLFNGAQAYPALPGQVIGYAKVTEKQALPIIRTNKLDVEESTSDLIGHGFYMRNNPDFQEEEGYWYCVIKADKEKVEKIEKVWVPGSYIKETSDGEGYERKTLWDQGEDVILEYIKLILDLAKSAEASILEASTSEASTSEASTSEASTSEAWMSEPEKVLRFSTVKGHYWQHQMNIPTKLVTDDDLDLWSMCFEDLDDLKRNYGDDKVNWKDHWKIRNAGVWN